MYYLVVHSGMSYMELKRRHQDLLSEVAAMEDRSREQEETHWAQVSQFAKEIEKSKVRSGHSVRGCYHDMHGLYFVMFRRLTWLSGKKSTLIKVCFCSRRCPQSLL